MLFFLSRSYGVTVSTVDSESVDPSSNLGRTSFCTGGPARNCFEVGENFNFVFKKYYFMAPDKRDGHLIRYILDYGFYKTRLVPLCKHCGNLNSRTHVTNECEAFGDLRRRTENELSRINGMNEEIGLEQRILNAYFSPNIGKVNLVLEVLRKFAINLIITHGRLEMEIQSRKPGGETDVESE